MLFLDGVRVLDFTTLLPGPLATLVLAEAGADVIKIERPGGDPIRHAPPFVDGESVPFAMLNRGKRSIEIDLKEPGAPARVLALVETADVVIEQFRPGVMDRLGVGHEAVRQANPRCVYCAISGYGQRGRRADVAGHDLNYVAEAGLLGVTSDRDGHPTMPHTQLADIGAGSYPAVINILLALYRARSSGTGAFLDIAMTEQTFPFLWQALAHGWATGTMTSPNELPLTGGSPRYGLYPTADGRMLALGALEDHFWANFCELVELPETLRDDTRDPEATRRGVREAVAAHTSDFWRPRLKDAKHLCCTLVPSLADAVEDPQFAERGIFDGRVGVGNGAQLPAVPVPLAHGVARRTAGGGPPTRAPSLGDANALLTSA